MSDKKTDSSDSITLKINLYFILSHLCIPINIIDTISYVIAEGPSEQSNICNALGLLILKLS